MPAILIISDKIKEKIQAVPVLNDVTVVLSKDPAAELKAMAAARDRMPVAAAAAYENLHELAACIREKDFPARLIIFGNKKQLGEVKDEDWACISDFFCSALPQDEVVFPVKKAIAASSGALKKKEEMDECRSLLIDTRQDQDDLINIGRSLSSEKHPDNLLRLILFLSKKITGADAGSIYLVETDDKGNKRMRFRFSHTFSRNIPLEEFVMDINKKSIAGYVAVTGEVLNIPDVYQISPKEPFSFNSSFDKKNSYISRSMLVVPMRNHIDEIIGVIQLINSKEYAGFVPGAESHTEAFSIKLDSPEDFQKYVVNFDKKYNSLMQSVAGQAAVAIENNSLIKQIQNQFEEFVKASVTAIESRDPATSGHSFRVAELCKAMAYAVNDVKEGYLKDFSFGENAIRELEFAALLHDFGKVYIDLAIFKKAKKLFPRDMDNLDLRVNYLYRYIEMKFFDAQASALGDKNRKLLEKIREIKEQLKTLNEPAVTERDPRQILEEIVDVIERLDCEDIEGRRMKILSEDDVINLSIRRGSLNPEERKEIESHVVHTYNFVKRIPWPPEYRNIPEIALRHHETLDGSGYPDGIKGRENLLLQSRMMTIADIYDALAASDRPYKKAVPLDRVLKILKEEAVAGKLDSDLVDLFIEKKLYETVATDAFRSA